MEHLNDRDKAILIGLYLSKFDEKGLGALGFKGFIEAYNVLALSIKAKPASLKNYRDEFDPYFDNPRKGWHHRKLREFCKSILDQYGSLHFDDFTGMIQQVVLGMPNAPLSESADEKGVEQTVSQRLITGRAAEEYFKINYKKESEFASMRLRDTTDWGCGYDFQLLSPQKKYFVEVKGLNAEHGSISMTQKEYEVAKYLKTEYCLFVVLNFVEKPFHRFFFNPTEEDSLVFKKQERQVVQTSYLSRL